ncbi:hypothetical protein JST56_05155 [Candidatus Dependentiae bacterium]|jgi:hypothetical protein|nr:hypothetical protein [Candidatus Dependentiae bacterium]
MTPFYLTTALLMLSSIFCTVFSKTELEIKKTPQQDYIQPKSLPEEEKEPKQKSEKEWNFIIYMVGNNLYKFIFENLKEMLEVGSTPSSNILVQIDHAGSAEATRFFIEKEKAVLQVMNDERTGLTRGTPASFYFFVKWAIQNHPAKHHAIILWNHASGIKHPNVWEKLYREDRDQLFHINAETGLLELNRRTGSIKHDFERPEVPLREWSSSFHQPTETFISEEELRQCMKTFSKELLHGQKVDVVILDACHLAMMEVATILKNSVQFMAGSQELEPGSGCNYTTLFAPFQNGTMTPKSFARHSVESFENEYISSFADFTFSSINLQGFELIENAFAQLSKLLVSKLKQDSDFCFLLKKIRGSHLLTTEFFDRDYIDLHHFLVSLLATFQKQDDCFIADTLFCSQIKECIEPFIKLLEEHIVAYTAGVNLPNARGISIYFPEKSIHSSYIKTSGLKNNDWTEFLSTYIKKNREI